MIRVETDATFKRWITGLAALPAGPVEREWQAATDEFFARTQTFAHVITGAMKASGDSQVTASGDEVQGVLSYGGGGVDYTIYELRRGDSHDFYARAWTGMPTRYTDALTAGVDASVREACGE